MSTRARLTVLCVLDLVVAAGMLPAQSQWVPVGALEVQRYGHTATTLLDGRILVTGGTAAASQLAHAVSSCEIFDPATRQWSAVESMGTARAFHTATLLRNGKVLVAGGYENFQEMYGWVWTSCELFDPSTGHWTGTGSMTYQHAHHTATLLANGTVLVAGSYSLQDGKKSEVYDPVTGSWTVTAGTLAEGRSDHTATLLSNGKVLVAGGPWRTACELYDPASRTWSAAGNLSSSRTYLTATLANVAFSTGFAEAVVVVGGGTFELYRTSTGTWSSGGTASAGSQHSATLLSNGQLLLAGDGGSTLIDLTTPQWTVSAGPALGAPRSLHTATLMRDGRVLITGGCSWYTGAPICTSVVLASAYVADVSAFGSWGVHQENVAELCRGSLSTTLVPSATLPNQLPDHLLVVGGCSQYGNFSWQCYTYLDTWALVDPTTGLVTVGGVFPGGGRANHTATLLPDGRVLVAGGAGGSALLFNPALVTVPLTQSPWTAADDMSVGRASHTATLLPDGRVLVAGGTAGELTGEIYTPSAGGPGEWSPITCGGPLSGHSGHTATLLDDGSVLVAGGDTYASVIFEPSTGCWVPAGTLHESRADHTATLVDDGRVLVAGGESSGYFFSSTYELFDPSTRTWTKAADPLTTIRSGHSSEMLLDDRVFLVAGAPAGETKTAKAPKLNAAATELFASWAEDWSTGPGLPTGDRQEQSSSLLPSGAVAVVGGYQVTPWGGDHPALCTFDAYSPSSVSDGRRRPVITTATVEEPTLTVQGYGLGGDTEAAGGNSMGSGAAIPMARLQAVEGERVWWVGPKPPLPNFCAQSPSGHFGYCQDQLATVTFDLPDDLDVGWYFLSVWSSGVASAAKMVNIGCSPAPTFTDQPDSVEVVAGEIASFSAAAAHARWYQWQYCDTGTCLEQADWLDLPGATGTSYQTEPVVGPQSGRKFRCEARGSCFRYDQSCSAQPAACAISDVATLTVEDSVAPAAAVEYPSGGEYWLLSEAGQPPSTEVVTWSMSDNVRVCQVDASLEYSDDSGATWSVAADSGAGLPATFFGPGGAGACAFPGLETMSLVYTVPEEPPSGTTGSVYRVRVKVTDHAGNVAEATSPNHFFMVRPNPDAFDTLILANPERMKANGFDAAEVDALMNNVHVLANHPLVTGHMVDLGGVSSLDALYTAWDTALPEDAAARANDVLFAAGGIHDKVLELLSIYTGIKYLVVVGDDRIVPFARLEDGGTLLSEDAYPLGGDLTATGTTVGQAIAAGYYLSDDPLAVVDDLEAADLEGGLFVPDLAVGRLVEDPQQIGAVIATFISQSGLLDLTTYDPVTGHKTLITGYDFLLDVATVMRERWKGFLGDASGPDSYAPVDGSLISSTWGKPSPELRSDELLEHLSGAHHPLGGGAYGVVNLNGHASHFEEGVPGEDPFDIHGLDAAEIATLDLAGSVVYGIGCHAGLSVSGSSDPADHPLDLPEAFLKQGAIAYVANTGYGWGLLKGIGYGERLVQLLSEELTSGGTVRIGTAVARAKQRYFLECPHVDAYGAKSLMQWTLYGLPMYGVRSGSAAAVARPFEGPAPRLEELTAEEKLGEVVVHRRAAPAGGPEALPPYVTKLSLSFDLSAPGVYVKRRSTGEAYSYPWPDGCDDPEGCYYTLNGLVERATGATDLPLEPYLVLDSRLAGTSQHGVLWLGGEYAEETGWIPVLGQLMSNGGDGSDHGAAPKHIIGYPVGGRDLNGADPDDCRAVDYELNSLVLTTGQAMASRQIATIDTERVFRQEEVEVYYYNNTATGEGNCDREGPLGLAAGEGPYGGAYHQVSGSTVSFKVPVSDTAGVWRVVVVYNDSEGQKWLPVELSEDPPGSGEWTGSLDASGLARVVYVVQAVDTRGNVSWLEYQVSEPEEMPSSGVEKEIPLPVEIGSVDLAVAVDDGLASAVPGTALTYDVVVTSAAEGQAVAGARVEDRFPSELSCSWKCGGSAGTSCTPGPVAGDILDAVSLPPGGWVSYLVQCAVDPAAVGTLANTASVMAPEGVLDRATGNNTATDTTELTRLADLALVKKGTPNPVAPGGVLTYWLEVSNQGPSRSSGGQISDTLPAEVELVASASGCSGMGRTVTCPVEEVTAGGRQQLSFEVEVDAGFEGVLVNSAVLSAVDGDPNPGNESATAETVVDAGPPEVTAVALDGTAIEECAELTTTGSTLAVTYSEAMWDPAGDWEVGDVSSPASYLLVAAGADRDLDTEGCGALASDDAAVAVDSVVYDPASRTATLAVNGSLALSAGSYRLLACATLRDERAGYALDGDGNGSGGDDFARRFRLERGNAFANAHLDCGLEPWSVIADTPFEITHSEEDVDGAASSGSVRLLHLSSAELGIAQCVVLAGGQDYELSAMLRLDLASGTVKAEQRCGYFGAEGCTGAELGSGVVSGPLADTGGAWVEVAATLLPPAGTASGLCSVSLVTDGALYDARLDDLRLAQAPLFADGFESGDTSLWGATVP